MNIHHIAKTVTNTRLKMCVAIYLFIGLEESSEGGDLFPLGAEKRFELQNFLQETLSVPLRLFAAAQARVRHGAPLTAEVHSHLKHFNEEREMLSLIFFNIMI